MTRHRTRPGPALAVFLVAVVLLTACGADIDMTVDFFRGQVWEAVTEISLSPDSLALAGGPQAFDQQIAEFVAEAEKEGVRSSWEQTRVDETLVYTVEMHGDGLRSLETVVFGGEAAITRVIADGREVIHFSYRASSMMGLGSQTVRLRGGEIVSGNGRQVDSRTMEWVNPSGMIEATLTERSRINIGTVLVALAALGTLVALGFGAVWLAKRRNSPKTGPCPWCGFWMPEGARHCPGCGRPR